MLVACRLAGLSAIEAYYAGSTWARNGEADPSKGLSGVSRIHDRQPARRVSWASLEAWRRGERATSDNLYPRKRRAPRRQELDLGRGTRTAPGLTDSLVVKINRLVPD
jgi:hypothetical protein